MGFDGGIFHISHSFSPMNFEFWAPKRQLQWVICCPNLQVPIGEETFSLTPLGFLAGSENWPGEDRLRGRRHTTFMEFLHVHGSPHKRTKTQRINQNRRLLDKEMKLCKEMTRQRSLGLGSKARWEKILYWVPTIKSVLIHPTLKKILFIRK